MKTVFQKGATEHMLCDESGAFLKAPKASWMDLGDMR